MKILITGGSVHGKLDAVKIITNKFKGGLMAGMAEEFSWEKDNVTYVCSKSSTQPIEEGDEEDWLIDTVHHDGLYDYREKVNKLAKDFDCVILGGAVANLIPLNPLEGKFPSHDYKVGDVIPIDFTIAPRIVDEVKSNMKKNAHLFAFKLLSGATHEELIRAAYEILLESGATAVFANDATELGIIHAVTKERGVHTMKRGALFYWIKDILKDEYYRTEVEKGTVDQTYWLLLQELAERYRLNFKEVENGMVFGTIAQKISGDSFVTTGRGKRELDEIAYVEAVDHDNRIVRSRGSKATLNAPLLDYIFKNSEADAIVHYHQQVDGLPTLPYAPPGTVRDSQRKVATSFNVEEHGTFLLFKKVKKGYQQI